MAGAEGDVPEIGVRLQACCEQVEASRGRYQAELLTRNRLITEACDEGYAWRDVARWAGVSEARIQQLIAAGAAAA